MVESGIYKITNIVNNKIYIGSSAYMPTRLKKHLNTLQKNIHINKYLQSAFKKHGEGSFKFEVIETCELKSLIEKEQYWMDYYQSYDHKCGYNISPTAGSCLGRRHTEETKYKMSVASKGKPKSDEHKKKMQNRRHSEETKLKISIAGKGRVSPMKGKYQSEEAKKKNSDSKKGLPSNRKGITLTDEQKQKMSDSHIGQVAWNKGKKGCFSDETIIKMSNSHKNQIPWNKGNKNSFKGKEQDNG